MVAYLCFKSAHRSAAATRAAAAQRIGGMLERGNNSIIKTKFGEMMPG